MNLISEMFYAFEIHSPEKIEACFRQGLDPNSVHDGKPLIYGLITMYLRSPRFKDCMAVFVKHGVTFEDKALLSILLDNPQMLKNEIEKDKGILNRKYDLECTFTPLINASLLHICAEYNALNCAKLLINYDFDINTKAGIDEHGFGGQTPIFHCVNQHNNHGIEVLKLLLENNVDLSITLEGIIWGKGFEWETFIPAINPLSYALMGLLRQFQRTEVQIYEIIKMLLKAKSNIDFQPNNVPNKYLNN